MKVIRKGFTLIEIIVTLALAGMVSTMAFSIVGFSKNSVKMATGEFDIQATTRNVMEKTNNTIRYATAVFTIPTTSFRHDNLTAGWNYLGVEQVAVDGGTGSQIVNYVYDYTSGTHVANVLYDATEGVVYNMVFDKINAAANNNLIKFTINCSVNGGSETSVTTELEDLNALQVINYGTDTNPATAVAYRNDERSMGAVANVAMVLDVSGSMNDTIQVGTRNDYLWGPRPIYDEKIDVLESEAGDLIDGFAQEDNIDVSIVPFSTTANNPLGFYNAKNDIRILKNYIGSLRADGGTNTGDGLRRAYYLLRDHRNSIALTGVTPVNYVILLVDGETTFATKSHSYSMPYTGRYYKSDVDYYNYININNIEYKMDDGNVVDGRDWWETYDGKGDIIGVGNEMHAVSDLYVTKVGQWYKNTNFAKVYLIAFTDSRDDSFNSGIQKLKTACGIEDKYSFDATDENTLNQVFAEIRQDILNDLWYLNGPSL